MGFAVATSRWSASNNALQVDLRRAGDEKTSAQTETRRLSDENSALHKDLRVARERIDQLQKEIISEKSEKVTITAQLADLRAEYFQYRLKFNEDNSCNSLAVAPTAKAQVCVHPPTVDVLTTEKKDEENKVLFENETVEVKLGESGQAFGGDVLISLIASENTGYPLRRQIISEVGSPGKDNIRVKEQEVGQAIKLQGGRNYEVRLLSAGTFKAKFLVTRL